MCYPSEDFSSQLGPARSLTPSSLAILCYQLFDSTPPFLSVLQGHFKGEMTRKHQHTNEIKWMFNKDMAMAMGQNTAKTLAWKEACSPKLWLYTFIQTLTNKPPRNNPKSKWRNAFLFSQFPSLGALVWAKAKHARVGKRLRLNPQVGSWKQRRIVFWLWGNFNVSSSCKLSSYLVLGKRWPLASAKDNVAPICTPFFCLNKKIQQFITINTEYAFLKHACTGIISRSTLWFWGS